MGEALLPPVCVHRIDIKVFCWGSPCALLSWCGNTTLNRAIQQYANNLGFTMNSIGIGKGSQSAGPAGSAGAQERIDERWEPPFPASSMKNSLAAFRTEFDVYSWLGLRFIPPRERCLWGGFAEAGGRGARKEGGYENGEVPL